MGSSPKVPVLYQMRLQPGVWRIAQDAEITGLRTPARTGGAMVMHAVDGLRQFLNSAEVTRKGAAGL